MTKFLRQISAVAATYLRRKILWFLLVLMLLSWSVEWYFAPSPTSPEPGTGMWWMARNAVNNAAENRRVGTIPRPWYSFEMYTPPLPPELTSVGGPPNKIVNWSKVRSLWINGLPAGVAYEPFPPEISQSTRLQALQIRLAPVPRPVSDFSSLPEEERRRIGDARAWVNQGVETLKLSHVDLLNTSELNYLELAYCKLEQGTLAMFAQRFPIQTLVLDAYSFQHRYDELAEFQHVELLEIKGEVLSPDLIRTVLRLPRLQTLVINTFEVGVGHWRQPIVTPDSVSLTPQDLQALRSHPTLTWVFADWDYQDLDPLEVREQLRPVRALPMNTTKQSQYCLQAGMWGMSFLTGILFIQVWSHFLVPQSQLIPRYSAAHLAVPTLLLVMGLLISGVWMRPSSVAVVPAVALMLILPALIGICTWFLARSTNALQQLVGMLFGLGMGLNTLPLQVLLEMESPQGYWFLWGEYPRFTAGVLAVEVVSLILAGYALTRVARHMTEQSVSPVLNFIPQHSQLQQFQGNWLLKTQASRSWDWHGDSPWKRMQLWANSLPVSPFRTQLWMIFLFTLGIAGWLLVWAWTGQGANVLTWKHALMLLWGPLGIAGSVTPQLVTTWWGTRLPSLPDEILRPVSKAEFVGDVFKAYLWSCRMGIFGILAMPAFCMYLNMTWNAVLAMTVLAVGVGAFVLAVGLLLFAMRVNSVISIFLMLPAAMGMQVLMVGPVIASFSKDWQTPLVALWIGISGLLVLLFSLALGAFAYQRAIHREWGLK